MPDVRTQRHGDTTPDVVRIVTFHAAAVALPVLVLAAVVLPVLVAGVVLPVLVAGVVAVVAGVVATAWRLRRIDDRLASTMGAVPLVPGERPRLESVVESVAMAVGVAPPAMHVLDEPTCNSVVWGSGTGPIRCALTTGLLDAMDRVQLEAVMGHQLALVRDGCVDHVTVAGVLLGPLAKGPLESPVASIVHRRVLDRSVVLADLEGVRATRYPPGLVAALERVSRGSTSLPSLPPALGVLCFAAPHDDPGPFSVHPPIEDRIDLLREI